MNEQMQILDLFHTLSLIPHHICNVVQYKLSFSI